MFMVICDVLQALNAADESIRVLPTVYKSWVRVGDAFKAIQRSVIHTYTHRHSKIDADIGFSLCVPTPLYLNSDCHNGGWWMDWLDALSVSTHTHTHAHTTAGVTALYG
jgi:hypothetical protein